MRYAVVLFAVCALAYSAYGVAGDVIRTFTLAGQPANGVRGLAFDWSDGNVWAAGAEMTQDIRLGKFRPASGSLVGSWRTLNGAYWCFDIGFGYKKGGTRYIVQIDRLAPRYRLYTTTGSYYGSLADPFPGSYNQGVACDWNGTYIYASNYGYAEIRRWTGATWSAWATTPAGPAAGVAAGWGRVFVVSTSSDYKIYEFNDATGALQRSIPLRNWGTQYVMGMSRGRVNAKDDEESVFLAVYYPSFYISEVSVGDVTGTAVAPSSLGKVKAVFR